MRKFYHQHIIPKLSFHFAQGVGDFTAQISDDYPTPWSSTYQARCFFVHSQDLPLTVWTFQDLFGISTRNTPRLVPDCSCSRHISSPQISQWLEFHYSHSVPNMPNPMIFISSFINSVTFLWILGKPQCFIKMEKKKPLENEKILHLLKKKKKMGGHVQLHDNT